MQQGVVIMGDSENILYMNTALRKMLDFAIRQNQDRLGMLNDFIDKHNISSLLEIDLKNSDFLNLKLFDKKINEEENTFGHRRNSSSHNPKFSLMDLVLDRKKELIQQIYMIQAG